MHDEHDRLAGQWALVTGASSGLGADFARELAARGADLVLVARREERLRSLAGELTAAHGIRVHLIPMDLAVPGAAAHLVEQLDDLGVAPDLLINNAGAGTFAAFHDTPWSRLESLIQLDVVALTELTRLLAGEMVARGRGRILQVASISAYQPTPGYAAYAAAKAYVLSFGEAFGHELRGTGVTLTVVSPGVTATEFMDTAGHRLSWFDRALMMESATAARAGIRALLEGRDSVVLGPINAFDTWAMRFLPRRWATAIADLTMRVGAS